MVTTAARTQWPSDVPITVLEDAGLSAASVLRLKCFTLEESIVTRKIGSLSEADRLAARATLQEVLLH